MLHLYICICLCLAADIAHGTLSRLPTGITVHKGKVTWDEARQQCEREGGVIASPINVKALSAMKSVIGVHNITYYIGTKATNLPGQFATIEGVAFENMPPAVTLDMVQQLDQWKGECLAMSRDSIRSVPCKSRLPYMCYNTNIFNMNRTNCGPEEEDYTYNLSTGHCYKLHTEKRNWDQAHGICVAEGGHLAIIENVEEAQIIKDMISSFTDENFIFIGLRRRYFRKNDWISIFGQPMEGLYHDWLKSKPREDIVYQCGTLHRSGKLENIACDSKIYSICQKEPTI